MITLYGRSGSGSAAVEALLAVLGIAHEVVEVPKDANKRPPEWFTKLNPRGEVPALKLSDDSIMTESAAMMIHLADGAPAANLAPPLGSSDRAKFLRWIVYLATNAYMTDLRMYYPERYSTDESHADAIKAKAIIDLNRDFDILAAEMGDGPFILGKTMSAVDIYAAMLISWSEDLAALLARQPKLKRLYDAVSANPTIRKVWDRHQFP